MLFIEFGAHLPYTVKLHCVGVDPLVDAVEGVRVHEQVFGVCWWGSDARPRFDLFASCEQVGGPQI
jgi:hypothetical protein